MVKTIFHWKIILKYFIHAFFVISGWGVIVWIVLSIFSPPFTISLVGGLVGGILVGGGFSCIFSKKYSLYHFEEKKYENG